MGLMDNINAGLQQGMQSPLFNLGSGLIAGAQPFQNPGAQLMGAAGVTQAEQQRQQQLRMNNFQLQMLQQQWPYMKNFFDHLGAMMGGSKGSKSKAAPQPNAATPSNAVPPANVPAPPPLIAATPQQMASYGPPGAPQTAQGAPQGLMGPSPTGGGLLGDPMQLERAGIWASAFHMTQPFGKALQNAASFEAQYNPQIQAQLAVAKSAVGQAEEQLRQAQASGNPDAIRGAEVQLLTAQHRLQIAAFSGNVSSVGLSPQQMSALGINTFNPREGIQTSNGVATPIPGMIGAREALAGAEARGSAQGKTVRVWNPNTKQWGYVPASYFLDGGNSSAPTGASGAPTTPTAPTAPAAPLAAAPNPEQSHFMEKRGEEAAVNLTSLNDAAKGAKTANYNIDQMLKAAQDVQLGPAADAREWGEKWLGGLGQQFGVAPPAELKNYQILDKYGNQLAFAASRQMGSREAAQIVSLQIQSNPNKSLVQGSFTDIAYSMKAMNNYVIDKNAALQGTGAGSFKSEAQWLQQIDPRVWDLTLSPQMGEKWAKTIGKDAIEKAYEYMTPAEQAQLVQNIPMGLRKKWLASSTR